jgi:hypothetical protein
MRTLRLAIIVPVLFLLFSCAGTPLPSTTEDYRQGRLLGEQYAKRDAMNALCWPRPMRPRGGAEARTYGKPLRQEGRTEDFIKGFYWGYQDVFDEFYDLYCGP